MAPISDGREGSWRSYKQLLSVVESAIFRRQPEAFYELEDILKRFKSELLSPLRNPAKIAVHRTLVQQATTQGITVGDHDEKQKFPTQFVEEALLLSDIFDMNELAAVELLLVSEQQKANFPGLTRGLVAVLLYHDGRRCLVSAIRTLLQSREGLTWTLELDEEIMELIMSFTKQMMEEGLVTKLLNLTSEITLPNQLNKLQQGQAIGNDKHQRQLIDLITEQRLLLAESLFCLACQTPLSKIETLKLLSHLKKVAPNEDTGEMDREDLFVFFALLYSLNANSLESHSQSPRNVENMLPLLSDDDFIPGFHQEVCRLDDWKWPELGAAVQFTWGVTLRLCGQFASDLVGAVELLAEDDDVVVMAIVHDAFAFLRKFVIGSRNFYNEEYFVRRLHSLVTNFIVNMPLKVNELRTLGDDAARISQACAQESLPLPADQRQDFEVFMRMVGDLYKKDPQGLELAVDFWNSVDNEGYSSGFGGGYSQKVNPKQTSLSNFVRAAGELLPASLFVPYLDMLNGLASGQRSSHYCFNLLKTNGLNSMGAVNAVSWDHFFDSLKRYFVDLRHDSVGIESGNYQSHFAPMNITVEEQTGLEAVLRLTATVADKDEVARIAICENPAWLPLASLFGLIGCSIPTSLKGCILETLAAFAKSQETAASMWRSLEVSQILQTVKPVGQALQEGGLLAELEEIESRVESYPETRAFMKLLASLTEYPVPVNLGAGYRAPGFEPYLDFLRDSVLLKFKARAYQDPNEKWQVASGVLDIFVKLLEQFEPSAENMSEEYIEINGRERVMASKSPGYTLMVHMLNETRMLKMALTIFIMPRNQSQRVILPLLSSLLTSCDFIRYKLVVVNLQGFNTSKNILSIIHEASELLDKVAAFTGKKDDLERTALLALKLVEITLEKQRVFTHFLRIHNSSVMVSSLDQLLLGVGTQSPSSDCILQIARYTTHSHTSPELCLVAVKILYLICQSPAAQPEIFNILTANQERALELLAGFVDHLDIAEIEETSERRSSDIDPSGFSDDDVVSKSQIHSAIRQNIVRLLLYCLKLRSPNLSHYLLGFHGRKPIQEMTLQDPGILGTPRTCLHSILDLLGKGVDTPRGASSIRDTPRLTELCFQFVFSLCQNKETSEATIRYLRTSHDYFYSHLVHLPFKDLTYASESSESPPVDALCRLNQQSWVLRSVATELRLTAQTRQRSHAQRLLALLLAEPSVFYPERDSQLLIDPLEERDRGSVSRQRGGVSSRKISAILDSVRFSHVAPEPLQSVLNYFDPSVTEAAIASCDEASGDSPLVYTNLRKLYKLLTDELEGVQGPTTEAQKKLLVKEVNGIMNYALERNRYREGLYSKQQAFEAWRQLVEVILASCPPELLGREVKQTMIFDLMRDLLAKMSDESSVAELIAPVSGVILTLMAHLRQSTLPSGDALEALPSRDTVLSTWKDDGVTEELTLPTAPLNAMFQSLIEALLKTSGSYQRVRTNLYGALLYYLQIGQHKDEQRKEVDVEEHVHSSFALDGVREKKNYEIISSFGDSFMEIVCRDACDGHDVTRMLSCGVLDAIMAIDWRERWMHFLNTKGYLRHLVESLLLEDESLQNALLPTPEPLRSLYVYESKMALLTRIAQSANGAKALLNSGVMSRLSECRFIDHRPSGHASHFGTHAHSSFTDRMMGSLSTDNDSFVPSVMERYQQLLIPALRMSLSLLTSLGQEHHEASIQVLHFIVAHSEVFSDVLQDQTNKMTVSSLHELYLVSGIICKTGVTEDTFTDEDTRVEDQLKFRAPLSRIQRLMLALLPKYSVRENWDKIVREVLNLSIDEREVAFKALHYNVSALEAYQTLQQIYGNLITYCRNVIVSGAPSSTHCRVLFAPTITDGYPRDSHFDRKGSVASSLSSSQPSLAIIVRNLKICTEKVLTCVEANKQANLRLSNIDELNIEELNELGLQYSSTAEPMSTQQKQQLAFKCLREVVKYRIDELDMYLYIIENSLFILCKHLEFYYLHCVPSDREVSSLKGSVSGRNKPRRLQEFSSQDEDPSSAGNRGRLPSKINDGVTKADIQELKTEAASSLTDSFLRKLSDIEKTHGKGRSRVGFVDALTRRIKRLLNLHGPSVL